ncbi:hypothetical protein FHX78_116251 [Streptomyces capillispiralis]|uniref:Uncharacterized protein n=1 Tax=Streptomyces capillispiralis TaxID=68182 RepID=A0A561TQ23_9ACTN|nr:hypothetical protein FHX78_116251 [Streptomyces capillispiralis]
MDNDHEGRRETARCPAPFPFAHLQHKAGRAEAIGNHGLARM